MTGRMRAIRCRSGFVAAALLAASITSSTATLVTQPVGFADAATSINIPTTGPLGAVTVIGDSVLNGAGVFSPTLPDRLVERGWGPIRFRATGSATSGKFPVANEFRSSFWIDLWQSQGWDPTHVIVNLGVNDSGFCGTSFSCAHETIMHMVNAIGPGHEIWWPTITKPAATASQNNFNAALRQVAAERSDFHVWDWFAEFNAGGYQSGDGIHLHPSSYRKRSERMAEQFTLDLGTPPEPEPPPPPPPPPVAEQSGEDEPLPDPTGLASSFTPVAPRRLHDTRLEGGGRISAGSTLAIDVGGVAPGDATAVALYVAVVGADENGYLSAGPCGADTSGATVNFRPGSAIGAPTVTAVGLTGDVCIFASADVHITVDLQGVFTADDVGLKMNEVSAPERLGDTRPIGPVTEITVDLDGEVDDAVDAVIVNLATVGAQGSGFLSAAPCGEPSGVANVNFSPGPPTSASAFVPVGDDGTFCVTASTPVDIVVDLNATLAADGELSYVPVAPTRMADTRNDIGVWGPIHPVGDSLDWRVAPAEARAVTGTLTLVRPETTAYASSWLCAPDADDPSTASINSAAGVIAANSLTSAVREGEGRLCLFSSSTTHTVFDVNGWWLPSP